MRFILNIIWLVFSGLWLAILYTIAGVIACVLIITIPFGIASFRIAGYALWPFGRQIVQRADAGAASAIGNVLWILLFGWWLALGTPDHGRRPVPDDHRHPAGSRQLQADPRLADAPRPRDRGD